VQARILDEVDAGGGGDGGHVADVLHHRGDGDGRHDEDGGEVKLRERELLKSDEAGGADRLEGHVARERRDHAAADDAEQDRDDLNHALAPDVDRDDDDDRDERDAPVLAGVVHRRAREVQTDENDDRAGDDGREEAHDLLHADELEEQGEDQVQQARDHHAAEGVGKLVVRRHRGVLARAELADDAEAAEVGEGRAEEGGHLELREDVEQQRAESRHQQRGLHRHRQPVGAADDDRHDHRRAEHGAQMLEPEHEHARRAELPRVVDGFLTEFFLHVIFSFSLIKICLFLSFRPSARRFGRRGAKK